MGKPWEPIKYKTAKELNDKIEEYFDSVHEEIDITITGLVLFLGFESRQSFYDYEKKDGYTYTIKKARLRIENSYEKSLRKDGRTGDIFALKNFGWRDKQEFDINANIETDSTFEIVKKDADS
ncbi:MAG: terminase small subunit [Patescibacteria group bacterium]|nr:terminase small subunit [Patescibacteria group bacterium]